MSISISTSFCSCFPPRWVKFSLNYILLIDNYTITRYHVDGTQQTLCRAAIQHLANECSIANELQVDGSPLLNVRRASIFNVHASLMCYMLPSGCFLKTKMMFWTPTLCSTLHIVLHGYTTSCLLSWSLPHQKER